MVDFPQPLGPTMATERRAGIVTLTSRRIGLEEPDDPHERQHRHPSVAGEDAVVEEPAEQQGLLGDERHRRDLREEHEQARHPVGAEYSTRSTRPRLRRGYPAGSGARPGPAGRGSRLEPPLNGAAQPRVVPAGRFRHPDLRACTLRR